MEYSSGDIVRVKGDPDPSSEFLVVLTREEIQDTGLLKGGDYVIKKIRGHDIRYVPEESIYGATGMDR